MSAQRAISRPLVPGQGPHEVAGLAGESGRDRVRGVVGVIAVGQRHCEGLAAAPLHEGRHRRGVVGADDQVAVAVPGLAALVCGGRPVRYGPEIAQWLGFGVWRPRGLRRRQRLASSRQEPSGRPREPLWS